MSLPRVALRALVASLERLAARWSEDAKRYPERAFYRGYEQGLRDAGAEHALKWLAGKDTK